MIRSRYKKKSVEMIVSQRFLFLCDRDRIQTCNRLIRSQLLYSVELRGHCSFVLTGAKIRTFFESASILATLFSKNYSMKRELNSCHPSVSPTFQSLLGEL